MGGGNVPLIGRRAGMLAVGAAGGGGFEGLSGAYVDTFAFPAGYDTVYGLERIGSSLWLAALGSGMDDHLLRVAPDTGALEASFPSPTGGARAICFGVDDTVWSKPYSGDTTRIDPADGSELQRVAFGGTVNKGLCWRPDVDPDRIWYGATSTELRSYNLADGSLLDTYTIPFSGLFDAYQDFAWDQTSGTWLFLDTSGAGADYLHQVDPSDGTVLRTVEIDPDGMGSASSYNGFAFDGELVWLANSNDDFVTVIG